LQNSHTFALSGSTVDHLCRSGIIAKNPAGSVHGHSTSGRARDRLETPNAWERPLRSRDRQNRRRYRRASPPVGINGSGWLLPNRRPEYCHRLHVTEVTSDKETMLCVSRLPGNQCEVKMKSQRALHLCDPQGSQGPQGPHSVFFSGNLPPFATLVLMVTQCSTGVLFGPLQSLSYCGCWQWIVMFCRFCARSSGLLASATICITSPRLSKFLITIRTEATCRKSTRNRCETKRTVSSNGIAEIDWIRYWNPRWAEVRNQSALIQKARETRRGVELEATNVV
jgi:hypothetical protein